MAKRHFLFLVVLYFQMNAKAQDSSYSEMNMSLLAKNPNMQDASMILMYNRNLQFLFDSFAGYFAPERITNKEKEQVALRASSLKEKFGSRNKYPDSIASGWHTAILTDNNQFCKEVKVFVSKNNIKQLVIEDCIRISCIPKEEIKNARTAITLRNINTETEVLDVYFVNDLDRPALIDEPMQPGFVCFWTNKFKYLNERLIINDIKRDMISNFYAAEPEYIEKGVSFYIMKPGKYKFRATKFGNDKESRFEVKSGMYLKYRLN